MQIPLIDLTAQYSMLEEKILAAVKKVLRSGQYINGPEVRKLEEKIKEITGSKYAVPVANGTDGLVLTLDAFGIGQGDEVITSPYTFFATGEAIARVGAVPIFVDVKEDTFNISPELIEEKITKKTKAIIPVHLFGQPAEMDAIIELGRKHQLIIIEDACQALGASYKGNPVGSLGDIGCFSFFPTKNLGCYGDGGIVVTDNQQVAERIRMLAAHGSKVKYFNEMVGYNSRLDEIQAAILNVKVSHLFEWNEKRRLLASKYDRELKNTNVTCPKAIEGVKHVYHLYVITSKYVNEIKHHLEQKGISTGVYYPSPLHLQRAFLNLGYKTGDLPVSEKLASHTLALPLFPELDNRQQSYIIDCLKQVWIK